MTCDQLRGALEFLQGDDGAVWSTGSFLEDAQGLLFAGLKRGDAVTVFGIGGRVEPGESLLQALQREGLEEAGLRLYPADSCLTCFDLGFAAPFTVPLDPALSPRPALVWRGGAPVAGLNPNYLTAVWNASYVGTPRAAAEVDLLLWVDAEAAAAGRLVPVASTGALQELGAAHCAAVGTAARTHLRHAAHDGCGLPQVWPAIRQGLELLRELGAPDQLVRHSIKVGLVAVALGRQALHAGASLDLSDLALAAVAHDAGKAPGAGWTLATAPDHAVASGMVLSSVGLERLSALVASHMLPADRDLALDDHPLARLLFYADKVVTDRYLGLERRLEDLAQRYPRYGLRLPGLLGRCLALERGLAEQLDCEVPQLRMVARVASLGELTVP